MADIVFMHEPQSNGVLRYWYLFLKFILLKSFQCLEIFFWKMVPLNGPSKILKKTSFSTT